MNLVEVIYFHKIHFHIGIRQVGKGTTFFFNNHQAIKTTIPTNKANSIQILRLGR